MPTTKNTDYSAQIEKLEQQQQQAAAEHSLKMAEAEKAIEAAKAAAAKQLEEQRLAALEERKSEAFKQLSTLPEKINRAAAEYAALIREFAELVPHTDSRVFSTGAIQGEINSSPKMLNYAGNLPICFYSDNGDKIYLTSDFYQRDCDRARITLLSEAVKSGDVDKVSELMREA